jgi:nitroreductase
MLKKVHLTALFTGARSYHRWHDRPLSDLLLGQLYGLMKWGPTSANCSPALGLNCAPMSGFDAEKVNAEFFVGTEIKVNFMCNLGYGSGEGRFARLPHLPFEVACSIL